MAVISWSPEAGHESGPISPGTTDLITILLTPVAIAMVIYALFCFYWRSVFLRKKQVRHLLSLLGLFGYFLQSSCSLCRRVFPTASV